MLVTPGKRSLEIHLRVSILRSLTREMESPLITLIEHAAISTLVSTSFTTLHEHYELTSPPPPKIKNKNKKGKKEEEKER